MRKRSINNKEWITDLEKYLCPDSRDLSIFAIDPDSIQTGLRKEIESHLEYCPECQEEVNETRSFHGRSFEDELKNYKPPSSEEIDKVYTKIKWAAGGGGIEYQIISSNLLSVYNELDSNHPRKALQILMDRLQPYENDHRVQIALGRIYQALKWSKKAKEILENVVKEDPRYYEGRFALGQYYWLTSQYGKAIVQFRELLKYRPWETTGHIVLAAVYRSLGLIRLSEELAKKAIAIDPEETLARHALADTLLIKKEYVQAREQIELALRYEPDNDLLLREMGLCLIYEGKAKESFQYLYKAIDKNPVDEDGYNITGLAWRTVGDMPKAISTLEKAAKISVRFNRVANNLGILYGETGRWRKAIDILHLSLKQDPRKIETRFNLGLTYQKRGMYVKALSEYRQILEKSPFQKEVLLNIINLPLNKKFTPAILDAMLRLVSIMPHTARKEYVIDKAKPAKKDIKSVFRYFQRAENIRPGEYRWRLAA